MPQKGYWINQRPATPVNAYQVADTIAGMQLPNGAILINQAPAGYDSNGKPYYMADVYFSGTALYWALQAPATSTDLLAVAKNWLEWCLDNADSQGMLNRYYYYADGTTAASPTPPDAEDSNSAMILAVLAQYIKLGGSTASIDTPAIKSELELIASVMVSLQQPNGLTWVSSAYQVSDTEDQSEVYAGFLGMSYVEATVYQDLARAEFYAQAAARVQSGIMSLLYNPTTGLFDWSLNSPSDLSKNWYPDTISQVWPILYGVISPYSPIAQAVMYQINAAWTSPTNPQMNWQDRLDASSVALAAWMTGDASGAQTALLTLAQNLFPTDGYPLYVTTVADYGLTMDLEGASETGAIAPDTYVLAPSVTELSQTSGSSAGGTTVTITGSNLSGAFAVYFGTMPATILSDNGTQISVAVPAPGLGTVGVTVLTTGGISAISSTDEFTYIAPIESSPALPPSTPAFAYQTAPANLAFGTTNQVVEVVDTSGTLIQLDSSGAHMLATGVRQASVAYGPDGEVLLVTFRSGALFRCDSTGIHHGQRA